MAAFAFICAAVLFWFCYGAFGIAAMFIPDDRFPSPLRSLLRVHARPSRKLAGHIGRIIVVAVWLLLIVPPQIALVTEFMSGRLSAAEGAITVAEICLSAVWVVFLASRDPRLGTDSGRR